MMTPSGQESLPDLAVPFVVPEYVLEEIHSNEKAARNFEELPGMYVRVRVGYIDEMRQKPEELQKRLNNFVSKTRPSKTRRSSTRY